MKHFEIFQRKFFKRNLHVRNCTPNNAIYGDLGIFPVGLRLRSNDVKYYHRLQCFSDTQPVKWVFNELKALSECGFSTWIDKAKSVFEKHFLSREMSLSQFLALPNNRVKRVVKLYTSLHYSEDCFYEVNDTYDNPKLRTYRLFKSKLQFEPYLNIPNVKVRTALAQFRMSAHHLAIETMRYNGTPVHLRLCNVCNEVQDELHHLFQCSKHSNIRTQMLDKENEVIPSFVTLNDNDRFVAMMSTKDCNLLYLIGSYLNQADNS